MENETMQEAERLYRAEMAQSTASTAEDETAPSSRYQHRPSEATRHFTFRLLHIVQVVPQLLDKRSSYFRSSISPIGKFQDGCLRYNNPADLP